MAEFWIVETNGTREIFESEADAIEERDYLLETLQLESNLIHVREVTYEDS